jgi:hypothetical protein
MPMENPRLPPQQAVEPVVAPHYPEHLIRAEREPGLWLRLATIAALVGAPWVLVGGAIAAVLVLL